MEPKYRDAKRTILGIFLILFFIFIIMAFTESWGTGLIWLISSSFLIIILRSYNRPGPRRLSHVWKILLLIFFGMFFIAGGAFLPNQDYKKEKLTNQIENLETEKIKKEQGEKTIPKIVFDDTLELNKIRNQWAFDVVKEWNGSYIENFITSKDGGTIFFQLTKTASKGNWKIDAELHESILQKKFDELISKKFNDDSSVPKTTVTLIPNEQQSQINEVKKERENLISRQFSLWDGSNRYLERYIKKNMNNPDCYEHITTNYIDKEDYILVNTKIRGCNAFGAKIVQVISAKIDLKGNILSIE